MTNIVQNRDEKPITNPEVTDGTCCDPNAPFEIRINPFSYKTVDNPDLAGDWDDVTDRDIEECVKECIKASSGESDKKSDSEHLKDFFESLEPYKLNDRVLPQNSPLKVMGQSDDRIIVNPSEMRPYEMNAFNFVKSSLVGSFANQFDLPACEFKIDMDPSEWLSKECVAELRKAARYILNFFHDEYVFEKGNIIAEHIFMIEKYIPLSHRRDAILHLFDNIEKLDEYQFFASKPSEDEEQELKKAVLYLLEVAFYFVWNIRLIVERPPIDRSDLLKGFKVEDDSFDDYFLPFYTGKQYVTRIVDDKTYTCNPGNNAFVYCRVPEPFDEENSFENQMKLAESYASENGINIIGKYRSDSFFGLIGEKEEFKRMTADMALYKPSYLIVKDQSRISSSMNNIFWAIVDVACKGVAVLYINE